MDRQGKENDTPTLDNHDVQDDFFGDQDEDGDFGRLARHETLARNEALKTIGYFESYDETKETLLQPGFEAGYREMYDSSKCLGTCFGKMVAETQLLGSDNVPSDSVQTNEITKRLHQFLSEFQNRPNSTDSNAKNSIELLKEELFRFKDE